MHFIRQCGLRISYWTLRFLIWLRYRVEVTGLAEIEAAKEKGILFLPNHPAEMDPLILIAVLWPSFKPRPLVVEHFYYQQGLRFFMDLVNVLPLPTMETGSKWKERQVEKVKKHIVEEVDRGENFLIYPSGKLKRTPDEQIGGASLIPDLLRLRKETKMVLIRTTGLWGSTFSRALTGTTPDFEKMLWNGFKTVLKNGIFFTPRRHIKVELEFAPEDMPRQGEKIEINQWLENWYNKDGPEELKLVSFLFWKKKFPEVIEQKADEVGRTVHISEDKRAQVLGYLSKMTRRPVTDFRPHLHFSNDLGLDSIDVAQLNVFLEERFDITGLAPGQLQTVNDLFEAIGGVKKEAESPLPEKKKSKWPHESYRPVPQMAPGKTIPEVFLASCDRMGDTTACADAVAGILSYRKLKRSALVLSLKIREMPGEKIGILLPSSVGAYITILATQLAGKVPVMLNWTTGPRNLEHAAEVCQLKTVLSSYRFLSRIENVDLGKLDDLLVLLEEVRRTLSLKMKLKGLFLSFGSAAKIIKTLPKKAKEDDPAVVIFTSGTETLPKGVPLTHRNILSNQRAGIECLQTFSTDILYGVLPPFHSFGFSATGIFPLLAGIKVCFAPDPTDSRSLANDIEHWRPTLFCCAPSFIQGVLYVAKEEQLESLRLIIAGAEKTPQALFDLFKARGKTLIEGYGISECSPIVTLTREGEAPKGVGKPLPGVEICIIDLETEEVLDPGQEGEICVTGPSVFPGYLGIKKDPFIRRKNKLWYRSGDRGYVDPDGNLILTGRLKRFVKIGGEMISLGGIEEDLLKIYKEKGMIPEAVEGAILAVAAAGRESEKPQIVLYTTVDTSREEINKALKDLGHGRLVKIAEIRRIDEIPLTGTGKIHYRLLEEML